MSVLPDYVGWPVYILRANLADVVKNAWRWLDPGLRGIRRPTSGPFMWREYVLYRVGNCHILMIAVTTDATEIRLCPRWGGDPDPMACAAWNDLLRFCIALHWLSDFEPATPESYDKWRIHHERMVAAYSKYSADPETYELRWRRKSYREFEQKHRDDPREHFEDMVKSAWQAHLDDLAFEDKYRDCSTSTGAQVLKSTFWSRLGSYEKDSVYS